MQDVVKSVQASAATRGSGFESAKNTTSEPSFVATHPDRFSDSMFGYDVPYHLDLLGEYFSSKKSESGNFLYGNLAQWSFGLANNLETGLMLIGSIRGVKAGFENIKTYQTYTKENFLTREIYSGKTSGTGTPEQNVARRDSGHHMSDENWGPAVLDKSHAESAPIRGREQQLIDANGGAKSQGGTSGNKINGISPNNPKIDYYLDMARKAFEFK
jgi:hypothetical protein